MGTFQDRIDAIEPSDMQGDISDMEINTLVLAIAKAIREKSLTCEYSIDHELEMTLYPSRGKVTAWESLHAYVPFDVVSHAGKRWICARNNGSAVDIGLAEEPDDAELNAVMRCIIPAGTTTFNINTGLTSTGIPIYMTGDAPKLDNNIIIHENAGQYLPVAYTIESSTTLTVTLAKQRQLIIQRRGAWVELSVDDELKYLTSNGNFFESYTSVISGLANVFINPVTPVVFTPVVLDPYPIASNGYVKTKLQWMLNQLDKLKRITTGYSKWHRYDNTYYESPIGTPDGYVNSTKYIDGNQVGSDAGSWTGPLMFDDIFFTDFAGTAGDGASGSSISLIPNRILSANRRVGTNLVRNYDLSFTFSGQGRITVGPLICDASVGGTLVWRPSIRAEQNRYHYQVDENLSTFRALYAGGLLVIYINGLTAIEMPTTSLAHGWEVRTFTGQNATISNYSFLAPDENLQQVKLKYSFSTGEFEQVYAYTIEDSGLGEEYPVYVITPPYTIIIPSISIPSPSITTGDLLTPIGILEDPFEPTESYTGLEPFRQRNSIPDYFSIDSWVDIRVGSIEGQELGGPFPEPPFTRKSHYYCTNQLLYYPIGCPILPTPYTAIVYIRAHSATNNNGFDPTFDWGITGILGDGTWPDWNGPWVQVASQEVGANTKTSIDISGLFSFPSTLNSYEIEGYGTYGTTSTAKTRNNFDIKLVLEFDYNYVHQA